MTKTRFSLRMILVPLAAVLPLSACLAAEPNAKPASEKKVLPPSDSAIIDSAEFDIDGNGETEFCSLSYGPTLGVYSVMLTASSETGVEYQSVFVLPHGSVSFQEADGKTRFALTLVNNDGAGETYLYDFVFKNGRIVLSNGDEEISLSAGRYLFQPNGV